MLWVLIVVLLVLAVAGLPSWPYAAGWNVGYFPSGALGLLVVILLILLLLGRI